MEIKLNVKKPRGNAVGSLRWMTEQIEKAELYFSNLTRTNRICVAVKFPGYHNEQNKSAVLAIYSCGDHDDIYWRERQEVGEGKIFVTHTSKPDYGPEPCVFPFPLTKAADSLLDELIFEAADKLEEYIRTR